MVYMKSRRIYDDGLVRSDLACVKYFADLICFQNQLCREILLNIKGILFVCV